MTHRCPCAVCSIKKKKKMWDDSQRTGQPKAAFQYHTSKQFCKSGLAFLLAIPRTVTPAGEWFRHKNNLVCSISVDSNAMSALSLALVKCQRKFCGNDSAKHNANTRIWRLLPACPLPFHHLHHVRPPVMAAFFFSFSFKKWRSSLTICAACVLVWNTVLCS